MVRPNSDHLYSNHSLGRLESAEVLHLRKYNYVLYCQAVQANDLMVKKWPSNTVGCRVGSPNLCTKFEISSTSFQKWVWYLGCVAPKWGGSHHVQTVSLVPPKLCIKFEVRSASIS